MSEFKKPVYFLRKNESYFSLFFLFFAFFHKSCFFVKKIRTFYPVFKSPLLLRKIVPIAQVCGRTIRFL